MKRNLPLLFQRESLHGVLHSRVYNYFGHLALIFVFVLAECVVEQNAS